MDILPPEHEDSGFECLRQIDCGWVFCDRHEVLDAMFSISLQLREGKRRFKFGLVGGICG